MPDSIQRWMREVARLTQSGPLARAAEMFRAPSGPVVAPAPSSEPEVVVEVAAKDVSDAPHALDAPAATESAQPQRETNEAAAPAASAEPSAAGHLGLTLTGRHTEAGLARDYVLFLPPALPPRLEPLPLLVMLHGCSQDPHDFAAGTGMNALASEQGFAVLYPAQSQEANAGRCWNWFEQQHQQRGRGEPALLASLTRAVISEHGLDARRVYAAGLSAGGSMAAVLGQTYPDLYAAIGIHSGLASGSATDLMSALSAMKHGPAPRTDAAAAGPSDNAVVTAEPVPAIVFHGDSDAVVHPDNGVRAIEAALDRAELSIMDCAAPPPRVEQGQSAQGRGYTRTLHTDIDSPRVKAEHWVIHGLGHAWSGGSANGSHTDPSGPDASREMWRFFSTHAQPERRSQRG